MAVLHWDRAIPWLAFDENPPQGVSRTDFYDGRIDNAMRSWIDAFADHFRRMASGYLAVSILDGQRTGLQPYRLDGNQTVADLTSQAFWLNHFLEAARDRDFEFYVQSFADDYEPIGSWTVTMGVVDADHFSLINNFACMGIYDAQGLSKTGVTET